MEQSGDGDELALKLRHKYGLNSVRKRYVVFVDEETIAFSVGNLVQFLNVNGTSKQKFMILQRRCEVGMIAVHPQKIFFVIGEGRNESAEFAEAVYVDVYEYPSLQLKKTLRGGAKSKYAFGEFSPDGSMFATVSSAPDYLLTIWDWENE